MGLRYALTIPAVVLLILAIVGILLVVLPTKEIEMPPENMYGIVLDAGSSHTSMYIYKWPADKLNGTGIVTQHSECHAEGGGISSYAGVPGGAAKSLEACLEQAAKDIPKFRHQQTPLYLGCTAGMRLLNIVNATESQQVLKEVKNKLQSYPFDFKEATILSGQEEGAYGWVTVNYLLENFVKCGFVGRWLNPGRETIGALDLGGASTQITFETSEEVEDKQNVMALELYGKNYKIYTQSFLCYGQDQFLKKLLAHLIMAFSAFFFTHSYINRLTNIPITSPSRLEEAIRLICNMTISEMTEKTNQSEKYMKNVCAVSNFVQVILTKGYGFNEHSFPSISFQKKAGGASVGWALGYMLSQSNIVQAESLGLMKALPSGPWTGILFLFITLLLIAVGYLIMIYRTRNREAMV
ncbi:ectonucleoside triphosphate diphosphohydrolase 2-like isoform X2 [Micropterus dolomieu]|uniref:ectonucleoside triphosphate diphosphohydrolase 2-like isoform X2 n=1 Tax=Micropterus dolomieu TaxID=147949 RepID=UPI001E8DB5FC|nr:ectonucleoside triphosphate diphosphohydrolase 2-like isoform X2 [Micropterus dolomieu]